MGLLRPEGIASEHADGYSFSFASLGLELFAWGRDVDDYHVLRDYRIAVLAHDEGSSQCFRSRHLLECCQRCSSLPLRYCWRLSRYPDA